VVVSLWGLLFVSISPLRSQQDNTNNPSSFFVQLNLGSTLKANTGFPETGLQTGLLTGIGWHQLREDQQWAQWLRRPTTGILFGVTDFGNPENVGYALAFMPYLELNPFSNQNTRWKLRTGLGFSYLNRQFDPETNPFNRAVSTDIKWSFRSLLYYDFARFEKTTWRVGFGYTHHSNGHMRLPNQGLNSVVASLEADFHNDNKDANWLQAPGEDTRTRTIQNYFALRAGLGQNVLSEIFNDRKEVYTIEASYGKIINSTFKFGLGLFYRFYEHYYDYIKNEEQLIGELYPYFREKPFRYSTNYGITAAAELLMGHVGAELSIGFNIYKPAYKIEWQLNDGYTYQSGDQTIIVLGELDSYYEIKRSIPARLGLKWYFISTNKNPRHNIFLGAHLNANLGQADFTELSLGYVRRFDIKTRQMKN